MYRRQAHQNIIQQRFENQINYQRRCNSPRVLRSFIIRFSGRVYWFFFTTCGLWSMEHEKAIIRGSEVTKFINFKKSQKKNSYLKLFVRFVKLKLNENNFDKV